MVIFLMITVVLFVLLLVCLGFACLALGLGKENRRIIVDLVCIDRVCEG